MKTVILGAAGFIGTNLALKLAENEENKIIVVDEKLEYFDDCLNHDNVERKAIPFHSLAEHESLFRETDIIYHLVSTNTPTSSNKEIASEITENISITISVLEQCVKFHTKKVVFLSSGGTVYGMVKGFPIDETCVTNPITTYGIQKLTIEKLLYLYNYVHGLDYAIIRLSNPYGPYQRPNGRLGAVTTFTYKAMKGEEVVVYGDGTVVRDYIFISDAIAGIIKIAESDTYEKVYNLGSGKGISINELLEQIRKSINIDFPIKYIEKRSVDVPINYLDVSKYESRFGQAQTVSLEEGIKITAKFLDEYYG